MTFRKIAALLLLALGAAPARAQAPAPDPAERAYIASRLYSTIQSHFAHWEGLQDFDLDSAYRAYLGEAMRAPDRLAFDLASQAFLASLRNGHTIFMDPALLSLPVGRPVGFTARWLEGSWVVTDGSAPGLRPGDVVAALDGQPMEAFYQSRRRYLSASTERWARRRLFAYNRGFASSGIYFPLTYTLTLADGRRVTVDRRAAEPAPADTVAEGRWLVEGQIAYVRIPGFAPASFESNALEWVRRFSGAHSLVLDVRGNSGGNTPSRLMAALMERQYRWWAESTPMTLALYQIYAESGMDRFDAFRRPRMAWSPETQQPSDPVFRGRLFLLVDDGCNSACEDFAMPFKDNGRATLVGAPTAGSSGQPDLLRFDSGMLAIVGSKREMFPDGSPFEGVGIRPDVEISPTRADIAAGRDPVLARALELARAR